MKKNQLYLFGGKTGESTPVIVHDSLQAMRDSENGAVLETATNSPLNQSICFLYVECTKRDASLFKIQT
jgi:hypothetical protein